MSLLDAVGELRKLESEATSAPWEVEADEDQDGHSQPHIPGICDFYVEGASWKDILFVEAYRNAAPALLQVLRLIQKGDAEILSILSSYLDESLFDGPGASDARNCVHRLQEACSLMEV